MTAFGPYVSLVSGALATWLIQQFPGLHLSASTLATAITDMVAFAVGAGGTFAMQQKWLSGWQQWEKGRTEVAATAGPSPTPLPPSPPALPPSPPGLQRTNVDAAATAGHTDPIDQAQILPDAQEELASIPAGDGQAAVSTRPETAAVPDVPSDELELAES